MNPWVVVHEMLCLVRAEQLTEGGLACLATLVWRVSRNKGAWPPPAPASVVGRVY